jgi:hypothetical protein
MPGLLLGRRRSEYARVVGNIAMQPRARRDEGTLADSQMTRRADLTHQDRPATHDRPTGESRLGGDQDVLTHIAVVCDLDQIVDLRPAPDACLVEGRTIDRRVCANFDIILDDDAAALRHRNRTTAFVGHVAKTLGTEHDPRVKHDAIAHPRVFTQDGAGVDPAITTEFDVRYQGRVGRHDAARAHATTCPDDGAHSDRCGRVYDGGGVDMGAWGDALGRTRDRGKFSNQSGEVVCWKKTAKGRSASHVDTGMHDDHPRLARLQRRRVGRITQEDQFIGLGLSQGCEAGEFEGLVALDGTSEQCRQLGQSNRPGRSRHDLASEQHGHGRGPCHRGGIAAEEILGDAVSAIRTHHDQARADLLCGIDDLHVRPTEGR